MSSAAPHADAEPWLDRSVLRRQMPAELFELPRWRTTGKVGLLLCVGAVLLAGIARSDTALVMAALGVALGITLFALGAIGHESGHLTASRTRWLNDLVGVLTMSAIGMPARGWKVYHDIHHRHTGVLGIDTDAQYTVAQYVSLSPRGRRAMRWVCEHEFLFWPLGALIIAGICWSYAIAIAQQPQSHTRRVRLWNAADMVMALAVSAGAIAYGWTFGAAAFVFGIVLPLAVGGVMGAATFTTNHRNLPPLTGAQARNVRHHFHRNTRTLTFPRWLPGNWFTGYVPWQIEHHLFPTVAGCKLARVSPYVQKHARERGVPLVYDDYLKSAVAVARTRFAWGADGALHRFADIDRLLARGVPPHAVPGYEAETRAVGRRDLRDLFGLR
jgi:fatty acid desaturase